MVFESIVVDVLNRFLGDYVENLNRSQLKLGIWGGDVVLENLVLKQNALEELDIPVQTVFGRLGRLTLKIPWKNLYGSSVEATIERLFLVVNPNAEVKFDPDKEEKNALAAKRAELLRIEEAKKKEAEMENKMDETFVEKLVTQIIKNVQLKIIDIHIRYEDSITNLKEPFSFGITLHNLSVHTTDENWKQTVIQESVTKIFKIMSLEGLAIYWNPKTELYSKTHQDRIQQLLESEIATKDTIPAFYQYLLGPINAAAKLKLNPKPELDTPKFSTPKMTLSLHMEKLSISMSKAQYRDLMLLADSMDRMTKGTPYRKYRPDLKTYRGHYKVWWRFAYRCILEEEVKRRRQNWDWKHMLAHRNLCRGYASAYQAKLISNGKLTPEQDHIVDQAEKILDLLNLVVIRQSIEMEVERLGKMEEEARKTRGWFSGWFSGTTSKDSQLNAQTDLLEQFQNAMTSDEKQKLFRAIDYQENTSPLHFPCEFVATEAEFRLDKLQLMIISDKPVLTAVVDGVAIDMFQRPSVNAIRLIINMHTFTVTGRKQNDFEPKMVLSKEITPDVNLISIIFETKPLDKSCDQRVKVEALPLQMVYDAETVVHIEDVFKPPEDSPALSTLQVAAGNKFSDLKEKSALGMQYAVQQHTFVDLDIDIASSYLIVPQGGKYFGNEPCIVMKFGAISVKSAPRSPLLDVAQLCRDGMDDAQILNEIVTHSYDKISLGLTQMQMVVAKKGEDWKLAIASFTGTHLHLLQPTNLVIQIHKCLIRDDPRLPQLKVNGELEKIAMCISQDRLLTLCEIIVSMPLPPSEEYKQLKASDSKSSSMSMMKYLDEKQQKRDSRSKEKKKDEVTMQLTEVEAFFIMKELTMSVNRKTYNEIDGYDKFLMFSLSTLELTVVQKTFNLEAMVRLGAVSMSHHRVDFPDIYMLETAERNKQSKNLETAKTSSVFGEYLFKITYCQVDKRCPEFRSVYGSVEQLIEMDFRRLKILLHLESLQEIFFVMNEYQTRLEDIQSAKDRVGDAGNLQTIIEDEELSASKSKTSVAKSQSKVESIQMKMNTRIGKVELAFSDDSRPLALIQMKGARAGMTSKATYLEIFLSMSSLSIKDLNPKSIHTNILQEVGGDVMNMHIVKFNKEQFPNVSEFDMTIDAQLNTLRIIYLNWFITSMTVFSNNFQTAQNAIIEASSQAADAARERAQAAYAKASKVMMKIRMNAPIIIVPENSRSARALFFDMGRLNIANSFVDSEVHDTSNKVTVEEMTLELEEMKVTCGLISEKSETANERIILRPISFALFVKRSMSPWYMSLPDLDVSGKMKTIQITLGRTDYSSIMNIMYQNFYEGLELLAPPPKVEKSRHSLEKTASKMKVARATAKSTMAVVEPDPNQAEQPPPKTATKFSFTMDSFIVDISCPNPEADSELQEMDLARFCMTLLSLKGRMFYDASMHVSMLLVDCTLDDRRPGRAGKMTRYLERRRAPKETAEQAHIMQGPGRIRSMVDITYTVKGMDTFVDMRVFSFNLILAMDFMNKLSEFSTVEAASYVKESRRRLSGGEDVISKLEIPEEPPLPIPPYIMTVNFKIEQPDIILVESLEHRSCDALVLNMEARFKLRTSNEHMVADGGISSLQIVVRKLGIKGAPISPFGLRRTSTDSTDSTDMPGMTGIVGSLEPLGVIGPGGLEDEPPRYLLAPTHMSVAISQPPGSGMHVDIAITDIKITMSPDVNALMNRVMATMSSTEDTASETEEKVILYDDLWGITPFKSSTYWFLQIDQAQEAVEGLKPTAETATPPVGEICLLSSPCIVIAFEMEIGRDTIPVLVLQASLAAQVKDWSSEMRMESTWAIQMSYYNLQRAEWEPLVEPVEVMRDCKYRHEPWELHIDMVMRAPGSRIPQDLSEESIRQSIAQRLPGKTITMSCSEPLEITFSRTGMDVLSNLSASFSEPEPTSAQSKMRIEEQKKKKLSAAPYKLHNTTGLTARLVLSENNDFTVFIPEQPGGNSYKEVVLEPGASVPLQLRQSGLYKLQLNMPPPPLKLMVEIVEMNEDLVLPVERANKRYFPIGRGAKRVPVEPQLGVPYAATVEPRGIISDIVMQDAAVHIYLRSVVQVKNSLQVTVSVYYMTRSGNEVRLLGDVLPGGVLRLPLQAVYTSTAEIFFSVEGFTVSATPFVWRELQQEMNITKLLHCDAKDKLSGEKFYMKAVGKLEQVLFENTNRSTFASSCFDIDLKPAVKMQNCLPVTVNVSQLGLKRTLRFLPGQMFHLSHLAPNKASIVVTVEEYMDKCWVCTKNLPDEETELSVWSFESHDSPDVMTLDLGMHSVVQESTQVLSLYCPFWMMNKTGFTLSYKKCQKPDSGTPAKSMDESDDVIIHPKTYKDPILFSYRAKNFFGKKKASIRLEFGEWSEKFSLDVSGSSGVILCKLNGRTYQVAVTNQLTFNSLTKMVEFTPFFLIVNDAAFDIQYQELHRAADPWNLVEKNTCKSLWPVVEKDDKFLILRVANAPERTPPFIYTEENNMCLKLDNTYGGLHVEVSVNEGGTMIRIQQYQEGHAPALIVNSTEYSITLHEPGQNNFKELPSMKQMLYAWEAPSESHILILTHVGSAEVPLRQDGLGVVFQSEAYEIYWVSFLDGLQRVVLLCESVAVTSGAFMMGETEPVDTEMILSMQGMGISLVNDEKMQEVIYMSISNSGVIWEECKVGSKRYKKMSVSKVPLLEDSYQRYTTEKLVSDGYVNPRVKINDKMEVDFEQMRLLKPQSRLLRRTLEPGLWVSYSTSAHSVRIYARWHRLQIDQQLPVTQSTFPVALAPVPPPRSVAVTGVKPFMEVSIVERLMEHSKVRQYKYYKVLVQEFHIKFDMGLMDAMYEMFPTPMLTEETALAAFDTDFEKATQPLEGIAATVAPTDQDFYDNLHLSPLKVHMSFSLGGSDQLPSSLGTLLQSIGVTLTDMNDVIFKLSYYERNYEFLSQEEFRSQVSNHYWGQAIKQLYVMVLGLDVLGNPYGLVVGLKKGVEDLFYEPFQGAVQGPAEFAEGLFLGVRSLLGHTVGGAAGAVSRITGAMGHGLAALSLDKDFQRIRRDNINKPPANFQEGLARSGKGLVMGVVDGVTGVFTKPLEGARDEGVEGFFKGLGKGAVGLVARPTAGVVDFAAGSLSAVKRAADFTEEATKRRPPRYLPKDTGVQPFSLQKAEGYKMLGELEKGKFLTTDLYESHVWVIPTKEVAMCTDKRLLYLEKNAVFGYWQITWSYLWTELTAMPTRVSNGVYVPTHKKKILGMFTGSSTGKVIFLYDEQLRTYFLTECERLKTAADG